MRVKEAKHKFCNYLYDAMKHGRKKSPFIVEQKWEWKEAHMLSYLRCNEAKELLLQLFTMQWSRQISSIIIYDAIKQEQPELVVARETIYDITDCDIFWEKMWL